MILRQFDKMVFGCIYVTVFQHYRRRHHRHHRRHHHHHYRRRHHHLQMHDLLSRYILKHEAISPAIQSLKIMSNSFFIEKVTSLSQNLLPSGTRVLFLTSSSFRQEEGLTSATH
jgi:hypothetical protein